MTKQPSEGARRAAEERLAKFIAQKESLNCKTLDAALHHQSTWRRMIPEAAEMLNAAFPEGIDRETHSAEMRKALGIAKGRIGFLTSCVRSGESLNAIDDTETEAALAQIERALKGGAL